MGATTVCKMIPVVAVVPVAREAFNARVAGYKLQDYLKEAPSTP